MPTFTRLLIIRATMSVEDIALQMTPGIGPRGAAHLLAFFGDAAGVFGASFEELTDGAELKPELARRIVRREGFAAAQRELKHCARHGIEAVASTDPLYPPLLREIPDYPHVVYVQGDASLLASRLLSVVGTRRATDYGRTQCDRVIGELARRVPGFAVVSGLAFGIDAAAHRAALAAGVPTVAVLPCSLPGAAPAQHAALAREIVDRGGALLTEIHSQSRQNGTAYVARNRIIAALSAGCWIVESPAVGGSLLTANFANDYDRTVMALPGRVTDPMSAGTNLLIRNRKAQAVLTAGDIIRELNWDLAPDPALSRAAEPAQPLTHEEAALLEFFTSSDPVSVETLRESSGRGPGELAALLLGLEISGVLRQLPGGRYMKLP